MQIIAFLFIFILSLNHDRQHTLKSSPGVNVMNGPEPILQEYKVVPAVYSVANWWQCYKMLMVRSSHTYTQVHTVDMKFLI